MQPVLGLQSKRYQCAVMQEQVFAKRTSIPQDDPLEPIRSLP